MKLRPKHVFLVCMIAFTLAALALIPLQATLAAGHRANGGPGHGGINGSHGPQYMTLHQGVSYGVNHSASFFTGPSNNLQYNGGPVMAGIETIRIIFWYPTGSAPVAAGYNSLVQRWLRDSGSSGVYRNNGQYGGVLGVPPLGAKLGDVVTDTRAYPALTLFDSDIQAEITHVQSVFHFHSGEDTGPGNTVYFVFLAPAQNLCFNGPPPPTGTCFNNVFCAYHNFFGSTIYAAMPYVNFVGTATDGSTVIPGCSAPTTPNNNIDADSEINVMSHEQNESATDPYLNAWFDAVGNEVGDKCNFTFGPLNAAGADTIVNGHPYIVQEEWDNLKNGCVIFGP